jgi:hypothetical protein
LASALPVDTQRSLLGVVQTHLFPERLSRGPPVGGTEFVPTAVESGFPDQAGDDQFDDAGASDGDRGRAADSRPPPVGPEDADGSSAEWRSDGSGSGGSAGSEDEAPDSDEASVGPPRSHPPERDAASAPQPVRGLRGATIAAFGSPGGGGQAAAFLYDVARDSASPGSQQDLPPVTPPSFLRMDMGRLLALRDRAAAETARLMAGELDAESGTAGARLQRAASDRPCGAGAVFFVQGDDDATPTMHSGMSREALADLVAMVEAAAGSAADVSPSGVVGAATAAALEAAEAALDAELEASVDPVALAALLQASSRAVTDRDDAEFGP